MSETEPKNSLRVLFLTPSVRLLGARQSLLSTVKNLPDHIVPVVVCSGEGELTEELRESQVETEVVDQHPWRKLRGRVGATLFQIPQLKKIVSRFQPDVIHCNEYHITPQGVRSAASAEACCAVTTHVRSALPEKHFCNYELHKTQGIAVVSRSFEPQFEAAGLGHLTAVIYNGVDLSRYESANGVQNRELRREAGWCETDLVVGQLALISPNKQQLVLAEAVARANARGARVRLLLAGDAFNSTHSYAQVLQERIAREDLRSSVCWLPFQKDVKPIYDCMDLNALISLEEGFGRTIIEAGQQGIASIGSNRGGIPEIIRPNETGFLVQPDCVDEIADCLVAAYQEREKIRQMGKEAKVHIEQNFTLKTSLEKLEAFWKQAHHKATLKKLMKFTAIMISAANL
ncbi:MAG: glycosyltransferase family 4 protein [Sumerlaeia bacterium]